MEAVGVSWSDAEWRELVRRSTQCADQHKGGYLEI